MPQAIDPSRIHVRQEGANNYKAGGHSDYDQAVDYDGFAMGHNMILGHHDQVGNFYFLNSDSGHGFQQSPAMGRGVSELLTYGEYRTLDLSVLDYSRILKNEPLIEKAVI